MNAFTQFVDVTILFLTFTSTYTSTILGVSSFSGIGFFFSKTSGLLATGELLMIFRISL